MKSSQILCTLITGFVFAWVIRVSVPYYKKEQDRPLKRQMKLEADSLMNAIYKFADQNPEKRFPTNLSEVTPVFLSMSSPANLGDNLTNVCANFIYIQQERNRDDLIEIHKIILVEKLGHYKYQDGGYIGSLGNITRFYWFEDYKNLIEANGLSISRFTQN
jgi:hypothetical protein